jgi:hypothetical protein
MTKMKNKAICDFSVILEQFCAATRLPCSKGPARMLTFLNVFRRRRPLPAAEPDRSDNEDRTSMSDFVRLLRHADAEGLGNSDKSRTGAK